MRGLETEVKRLILGTTILLLVLVVVVATVGCSFSASRYTGLQSDHFDGDRSYNQDRSGERDFRDDDWSEYVSPHSPLLISAPIPTNGAPIL